MYKIIFKINFFIFDSSHSSQVSFKLPIVSQTDFIHITYLLCFTIANVNQLQKDTPSTPYEAPQYQITIIYLPLYYHLNIAISMQAPPI